MTGLTAGSRYVLDDRSGKAAWEWSGGAGTVAETISGLTPGRQYLVTGWVQTEDGSPIYVGAFDNDNTAEVFCIMKAGGTGFCTDMSFRAIERS